MSNLKQLGLAYFLYTGDYDGFYRPGIISAYGAIYGPWAYDLMPYCGKSEQQKLSTWWQHLPHIYICPSFREGLKNFNKGSGAGYLGSYMMNVYVSNYLHKLSWYRHSSEQIFFFDSITLGHGSPDIGIGPVEHHNEGANYLFMDGHVEWWDDPGDDNKIGWKVIQ